MTSEPVLVVGAGPSGLMTASELARHGVPCRIVDKSPTACAESRALGIHARSLEVFDQIGIIAPVLERGHPIHGVNVYADGQKLLQLSLDEIESPYPYVIDLPQCDTERILAAHLGGFGVQVERPVELPGFTQDDEVVTATLKHGDGREETLRTPYVVGCDGSHSEVRHILALPFEGAPYEESYILADVQLDWLLPDDMMHAFIGEYGIMAAFPMGGGRHRLVAEIPGEEGHPPQPTLADVQAIIDRRAPAGTRASDPHWLAAFRIHHRVVSQTRVGRAFLVGDAAHIHSPVGGQGMNTGMQDAYNLAWKLAFVLKGHASESLLESYQAERLPIARSVVQLTDFATRVITIRSPVVAAIRKRLAPFLAAQDVVRERAANRMSEIDVNYRSSPIVAGGEGGLFGHARFAGRPLPGDRAPDVEPVVLPDGTHGRLFDLLRGATGHTLLLLTGQGEEGAPQAELADFAGVVENRYNGLVRAFVVVGSGAAARAEGGSPGKVLDPDGALHSRYGAGPCTVYLIRPDGYIAYRRQPADRAHLQDYLGRIFR